MRLVLSIRKLTIMADLPSLYLRGKDIQQCFNHTEVRYGGIYIFVVYNRHDMNGKHNIMTQHQYGKKTIFLSIGDWINNA